MNKKITVTWLGHACYKLAWSDYSIVFDPFEDGYVPGFNPVRTAANQLLYSHDHRDHHGVDQVTLLPSDKKAAITIIDTYHDDQKGALRGRNKIHIVHYDNLKAAHFGDLGCDLTTDQEEMLKDLDLIFIPVGGYYTIDAQKAKEIAAKIKPRVTIPMHYRSDSFGFDVLGRVEAFTDLCDDVVYYDSNQLEITDDTLKQTAVLSYK